jgi:Protein of unknown function (DUF3326)
MNISHPYTVVLIIPTGIGASIGGYAGDALPVAKAIATVCDRLITHPNVLNGAALYWPLPNTFYVEGYGLDQFAAGNWGLRTVLHNRIGIIFDQAIENDLFVRHLQAVDAAKATLGLNITDYVITDQPLNVELRLTDSGASWGTIENPDSLLRAAQKLIDVAKVEAIAVVARFPEDINEQLVLNYRQGNGVDPIAGAEAVISHLIARKFRIPCAHAPACSPLPLDPSISPKSAAEELGYTFLPCVLVGLSKAPKFITTKTGFCQDIWADQVNALILPATACGGSATISLNKLGVKIIAVEENQTAMQVTPEKLGIEAIRVKSYLEALGILLCDRAGINPEALRTNINSVRILH